MNYLTADECMSLIENLPRELRVEVFVRLPVRVMAEVVGLEELLQGELSYLSKLHLDVAVRSPPNAFVLKSRSVANQRRLFVVARNDAIVHIYAYSCQNNETIAVCGTCRGYIGHVYRNYTDRRLLILLFNPVLNHEIRLPEPLIAVTFGFDNLYRDGLDKLYRDDDCSFGFLKDSDEFKVLRFVNATDAEIFRSPEKCWSKLCLEWPCIDGGVISLKKDPKLPLMLLNRPVTYFVDYKFYWIAGDEGFDFKAIAAFDIHTETFEIVTLVEEPYVSNLQFGLRNGRLCIHKRNVETSGCAISVVSKELLWTPCEMDHLYPPVFYHQFVATGSYEIAIHPFSQTLFRAMNH